MGTAQNDEGYTLQELLDLVQERMRWWEALCRKRRSEALEVLNVKGYEDWAAALDSVLAAQHNLHIRIALCKDGLVPAGVFRTELIEARQRLDGFLETHA